MNKDIIYIDTEDDITSIIGKIKDSKEKIIALVPPKRIGVLQSAVNLRLLSHTAKNFRKHLVIITNNQALIALTAAAKIPVAKNLQSKPEVAEVAALEIDNGEDIIDGKQLPVGDLVKTIKGSDSIRGDDVDGKTINEDGAKEKTSTRENKEVADDVISEINIDNEEIDTSNAEPGSKIIFKSDSGRGDKKIKIPDFSGFRKKLFLGVVGFIGLVIFMIWAIKFAPAATIIVTAQTDPAPVSLSLKLVGSEATDVTKNTIQSITKTAEQEMSVEFNATGTENVGEEATGTLTLSNADSSYAINVPAGSDFSLGDYAFTTDTNVDVPGAIVSGGEIIAGSIDVSVTAVNIGAEYNIAAGSYISSVSGITAYGSNMSGGSSHEATVVTESDIETATEALHDLATDEIRQQLLEEFANGETIVEDSFDIKYGKVTSAPNEGEELSSGKAKLTSKVTFTMTAIAKSEIETYLKDAITKQITNTDEQKIYDNGYDNLVMSSYRKTNNSETVNIATTGEIGPNIDQDVIKERSLGKRYGDVQAILESIEGISSVDIKFSYFWVTTVPKDTSKVNVEFVLEDE